MAQAITQAIEALEFSLEQGDFKGSAFEQQVNKALTDLRAYAGRVDREELGEALKHIDGEDSYKEMILTDEQISFLIEVTQAYYEGIE
jgi:hypothetical protein